MKKHLTAPVARFLFSLLLVGGPALAAEAPQLQQFKHTVLSPNSEQVVLQFNGSYSPKIFTLKGENPRVVFDFTDLTHGKGIKPVNEINGPLLTRMRVGMHGDGAPKTRVVFDVTTLNGLTYTQKLDEKTSTLTIEFTGPAKAATAETKAKAEKKGVKTEARETVKASPETKPAPAPQEAAAEAAAPKPPIPEPAAPQPPVKPAPDAQPPAPPSAQTPDPFRLPLPEPKKEQEQGKAEPPVVAPQTAKPAEPPAKQPAAEQPVAPADKPIAAAPQEPPPAEKTADKTATAPAAEQPRPEPTVVAKEAVKPESAPAELLAKAEEKPQLQSVRFDPNSPKGEMVLFQLNGFNPPAVHGVEEGIPRVICDFNNTQLVDTKNNLIKANGKFVKVIRTSRTKKPEKVRVVIDLEPNRSYDLQQVFFKEDNLFVLIVNTVKK